jgi:hypothetical protein
MNHRQFMEKLHFCNASHINEKILDTKPVTPVARFRSNELELAVYQNDVLRLSADALVCGMLTPVNPLGTLFRDYWGAGLAWGHTPLCPTGLGKPIDDEVVVKLDLTHSLSTGIDYGYIGVINPRERTIEEQLFRTLVILGKEFDCNTISLIAPTGGEPNFLRSAKAPEIITSVMDAAREAPLKTVNLVDEHDVQPFIEVLAAMAGVKEG